MTAYALHDVSDHAGMRRWGASGLAIVAAHAALVASFTHWPAQRPPPGINLPAIMVDLAPVTSAPQPTPMELAPGPVMQQADASPPEETAPQPTSIEQIAPTPPQEKPEVVAPPEPGPEPAHPKPESARAVPVQKPVAKPKEVRPEARKPSEAPPAPRTSGARAERQAPAASAASTGASAAATASYRQLVAAHLQRFKQYPPGAKAAGQQGVARVSFTLGRGGQVMSSGLAGSSGHAALDAETVAMVRRAQPFPAFPADIKQGSMSFSAPVAFHIR